MLLHDLQAQREEILGFAKICGLSDVRVFGSVAREEDTAESDIDILVNVANSDDPLAFIDFKHDMEARFGRRVDIVFERGLYHAIKDRVLSEAKPL